MYLPNKYTKWYNSIISRAQLCTPLGYTEKHHISPRCMGGNNTSVNLVRLTYREHRLCHLLLPYMVEPQYKGLMWRAAKAVMISSNPNHQRTVSIGRFCEKARIEAVNSRRGIPRSPETIAKIKATKALRPWTDEDRQKARDNLILINKSRKGIPHSDAHNKAVSDALKGKPGKVWTNASKLKASITRQNLSRK